MPPCNSTGRASQTGQDGLATAPVSLGSTKITVSKDGFFPANTTIDIDEVKGMARAYRTAGAGKGRRTNHGARYPHRCAHPGFALRVEVLQREEVEEKMLMTPGDIVMMLNEMGGMRVQTTSPSLGAASVRMQGMRGRYTRFLSDGFRSSGSKARDSGSCRSRPWISARWK